MLQNTFDMDFMERDFDFKPANSDTDARPKMKM